MPAVCLAWILLLAPPEALPRLAVAGGFRMGYAGVLQRAGLPYDFLGPREQCDLDTLGGYDLVLAGGAWFEAFRPRWSADARRALDRYVEQGGRLLCELGSEPPDAIGPREPTGNDLGRLAPESGRDFALTTGTHPFLSLFPPGRRWQYGAVVSRLDELPDGGVVLARFVEGPAEGKPAILYRRYGRGEVIYLAGIFSYIQGNWHPNFEDLILGAVGYLTAGRAAPQWAREPGDEPEPPLAEPAPAPEPVLPDGFQPLGDAPPDGYAISLAAGAPVALALEGTKQGHLAAGLNGDRLLLRRGGRQLLSVAAPAGAPVVLLRTPERLAVVVDGAVIGAAPLGPPAGACGADDPARVVFQPLEPLAWADDFTRLGALGPDWQVGSGRWLLTGTGEPYRRQPEFALRGRRGQIAAGRWSWTDYRAEVTVRPLTATQVKLRAGVCGDSCVELTVPVGRGQATLVRRRGKQADELARADATLAAHQWARLALELRGGRVRAAVDGRELADVPTDAACGGIAIALAGGEGILDDVSVAAPDDRRLRRVHPPSYDKGPDGLLDHDTWSHPAMAWRPDRLRGRFWHVGRFAGDLRLRLTIARGRGPARLIVHLGPERGPAAALALEDPALRDGATLTFERRGDRLHADLDGRALPVRAAAGGGCLGLEFAGLRLAPASIVLEAAEMSEVTFHRAAGGWWEGEGTWQVGARWPCQPQWAWLTGEGTPRAVWWQKHKLVGDAAVQVLLGVRQQDRFGAQRAEPYERLRVTLNGDGRDPWNGYVIEIGSLRMGLNRLYRNHEIVATSTLEMPEQHEIHNFWGDLRIERVGARIDAWFGTRRLFSYTDHEPLPAGQVAVWTENNVLATPYLAVYGRLEPALQPLPAELARQNWERRQRGYARLGMSLWSQSGSFRRLIGWQGEPAPPR